MATSYELFPTKMSKIKFLRVDLKNAIVISPRVRKVLLYIGAMNKMLTGLKMTKFGFNLTP